MSQSRIARRYAHALLGSAEDLKKLEKVSDDLLMLRGLVQESKEFALFIQSPIIKRDRKIEILDSLFGKKIQTLTKDFLKLLAEKGREELLEEVITEFFRIRDEKQGVVTVGVTSAVDLTKDQTKQLQKSFEGYTKKTVRFDAHVDESLKGGFVARVGDTVFDGSIKRQLELLRQRFLEGTALE